MASNGAVMCAVLRRDSICHRDQRRLSQWLSRRSLGEVWGRRYGNQWEAVKELKEESEAQRYIGDGCRRRAGRVQLCGMASILADGPYVTRGLSHYHWRIGREWRPVRATRGWRLLLAEPRCR